MYNLKIHLNKYCFIYAPIVGTIIMIILEYFNVTDSLADTSLKYEVIGIAGTLAGFLLTIYVMFYSLNQNTEYIKKLSRHKHIKIFTNCVIYGMIFLVTDIFLVFIDIPEIIVKLLFMCGLSELICTMYYIFVISTHNQN